MIITDSVASTERPQNVGIHHMDFYVPSYFVSQASMETFDGQSAGKYTIGLGQDQMAFAGDREDIVSMCLTVVQRLLEKTGISPVDIGRLEVGTETIIDKAKSVKSHLMRLFAESGNTDIEGADTMNACYGGTNALFSSAAWVESSAYDGRWALVVAADIAVYAAGPARPSGGAGAVAMLIKPEAPLVLSPIRASHMEHAYDFYKPDLASEYPVVHGHESVICYLRAVDRCFSQFVSKYERRHGEGSFRLANLRQTIFHAPFNKMVQKSVGRMHFNEMRRLPIEEAREIYGDLVNQFRELSMDDSYGNKALERAFVKHALSSGFYERCVAPSAVMPKRTGNMYCAAIFGGLLSLIATQGSNLEIGDEISMFSYGSGLCSSLYLLTVNADCSRFEHDLGLIQRLDARIEKMPAEFVNVLKHGEELYQKAGYTPSDPIDEMEPGTYYLTEVMDDWRRTYARIPLHP